jgi:hypothetical protein
MFIDIVSETAKQGPEGSLLVKTKLAIPEKFDGGVQVEFRKFALENTPDGEPDATDQEALVADPEKLPINDTNEPSQIVWSTPAFTIEIGFILMKIESLTEEQSPTGSSVLRNTQTPPFEISFELTL